jgi:hypothetical protein
MNDQTHHCPICEARPAPCRSDRDEATARSICRDLGISPDRIGVEVNDAR